MEWQAIASLAEEIFDIWVGSGDVRWVEQAWSVLDTAGLVDDSDEIERSISIVRLLCLATYYYEFIKDYQFEELEFELEELYGSVPIPAFRLGQLVGDHVLLKDEKDQDALCQRSLQILIDRYRGETVDALEEGFGGRCSLFLSLCRSTRHDSENVESIDFIPDSEIFDTQLSSGEFVAHLFGCSIKEEKQKFKSSDNALPILKLKFPDGIRQDINSLKVVHSNGFVFLEITRQNGKDEIICRHDISGVKLAGFQKNLFSVLNSPNQNIRVLIHSLDNVSLLPCATKLFTPDGYQLLVT